MYNHPYTHIIRRVSFRPTGSLTADNIIYLKSMLLRDDAPTCYIHQPPVKAIHRPGSVADLPRYKWYIGTGPPFNFKI